MKKGEDDDEASTNVVDDKMVYMNEEGEIVVDDEHPDIRAAVENALDELKNVTITLSASDYISTLRAELEVIRKERLRLDPTAAMFERFSYCFVSIISKLTKLLFLSDGGWVLDNFPNNLDQLKSLAEANIMPDTFIFLNDSSSDESTLLMRRWYADKKTEIDEKIRARLAHEEALRLEELRK